MVLSIENVIDAHGQLTPLLLRESLVLRFSYSQGKMRSMVIGGTDALIVNCGILVVR